jgi:hypothetical protein
MAKISGGVLLRAEILWHDISQLVDLRKRVLYALPGVAVYMTFILLFDFI